LSSFPVAQRSTTACFKLHCNTGTGDDDAAAFAMFDFLIHQEPDLMEAIDVVDELDQPSSTRIERTKLDHGAPLHWAVLKGRLTRVKFLIERGADIRTWTPKKKQTSADWARILGRQELIDYFDAIEEH
ncbi:MAG: hypothetical protein Q9226_009301, partial [Calogaya cf. arnoldii]